MPKKAKKGNKSTEVNSKDIIVDNFNLTIGKTTIVKDTSIKIVDGRRYGLMGRNGAGKTTLLRAIADKSVIRSSPLIDIFSVDQELDVDMSMSVFDIVFSANKERIALMRRRDEIEILFEKDDNNDLMDEYERVCDDIEALGGDKEKAVITRLLLGLGFSTIDQNKSLKSFSGGWQMRASLARALYMKPTLLLLDEPTNHLDMDATLWLMKYLSTEWNSTLVVVSHDKAFLDEIVTDIIHLDDQKLNYYKGDYTMFSVMYEQEQTKQMNDWKKYMKALKELKKEGKKKDEIDKFIQCNEVKEPKRVKTTRIMLDMSSIPPPFIMADDVSFSYDDKEVFSNVDFCIEPNTRIVLAGKNGCGKTTMLKVLMKGLIPSNGVVWHNPRMRIGYYDQHSGRTLPTDKTCIDYIMSLGDISEKLAHKHLGTIGLEGKHHTQDIGSLSGGQKARIALISIIVQAPHVLLLDEPTNHLDMGTIDSLIEGINNYEGGVVMVTHNMDVMTRTNSVLYELCDKKINKTDFESYISKIY